MGSGACGEGEGAKNATPITMTTEMILIAVRNTWTAPPRRTPREVTPVMTASQTTARGCAQVKTRAYGCTHPVNPGNAIPSAERGVGPAADKNERQTHNTTA